MGNGIRNDVRNGVGNDVNNDVDNDIRNDIKKLGTIYPFHQGIRVRNDIL